MANTVLPRHGAGLWVLSVDGDHAVLADERGRRHHLNATALALWHVCDGRTTVDEMVAAVEELYGMEEQTVRRDVEAALREMAEAGVVLL